MRRHLPARGPVLMRWQRDHEAGRRGGAKCKRRQVPAARAAEAVRPEEVPRLLQHVRLVRLVQVHQGVRERRAGEDAVHPGEAEERRHRLRRRAGGARLQHGVLRPGLHLEGLVGLGPLLHGLRRWQDHADSEGAGAHPRSGQVPNADVEAAHWGGHLQHAGVQRRRGVHCAAGLDHCLGCQWLPEGRRLRDPPEVHRQSYAKVRAQVLRSRCCKDWRCSVWQRSPVDLARWIDIHHTSHQRSGPHIGL
mmetsp:Transcript_130844/g.317831  ORF Transcript_130844/g.317831 Transcript_130844/m.317831 type:complete len:249 (-) Transcript_130844:843-1589(-)